MAHAYNPNYSSYYQKDHKLLTQNGIAIKVNINGSYATDSESSAIVKSLAKIANISLQVLY